MYRHQWTPEEDARLQCLAQLGIKEVRRGFPRYTTASIRGRMFRLQIRMKRTIYSSHRWRGKIPIPVHAHPIVRRIIEEANHQQVTLGELAERAGCSRKAISDWRYRKNPSFILVIAVLNVLGLDLAVVHKRDD